MCVNSSVVVVEGGKLSLCIHPVFPRMVRDENRQAAGGARVKTPLNSGEE